MKRENFKSRLGFILVSAGCAIGIGNVWRFPTITGENGGGVFVLFYLLSLICMGIPILTMELAVGRAGRASAGAAYRKLEPAGTKWHWHGWACLIGCVVLMMYYTTVNGWMISYFVKFLTGTFEGLNADQVPRCSARCWPTRWRWASGWCLPSLPALSSAASACKRDWSASANG